MELTKRQMDIVNAAITIIAQKGYEKLTTKNLAAELGLTEAALYRHFASKHELVVMLLCHFEQLSCEVIKSIREQGLAPLDGIRHFVLNRYELFAGNPNLAQVMFSEELFKNDPSFIEQYQSITHVHKEEVIAYITAAQNQGKIDKSLVPIQLFRIIVGSMRMIVSQWNMSKRSFDLRTEGAALLETIIKLIEVKK